MKNISRINLSAILLLVLLFISINPGNSQSISRNQATGQAMAPPTQPFGDEAFNKTNNTEIRWLGNAGFFINSRGTTLMLDPVLKGFDMPLLIAMPIKTSEVPKLDAVLITHVDNDHFSLPTTKDLENVTKEFHSTHYVDSLMRVEGFPSAGHGIGDSFTVGQVKFTLTSADHNWQNGVPELRAHRFYKLEDYCGFWMETPDGTIWATGDSRLLPEHLNMPAPDAIFFDFSDNDWHFTLEGAIKIANAYPNADLLLNHWGSVDAPDFSPFNGDPTALFGKVVNPERIHILAAGEAFVLKKK